MKGPKGIRVQIALVALLGTLIAAGIIVAVVSFSAQALVRNMVAESLEEHLDKAQEAVELGDYEAAVVFAGSDVLQVVDADGNVIASSANAKGLPALASRDDDDKREIEKLDDVDDDDDDVDDDDDDDAKEKASGTAKVNGSGSSSSSYSTSSSSSDSDEGYNSSASSTKSSASSSKSDSKSSDKSSSAKNDSGKSSAKNSSSSKKTSKAKSDDDDDDEDDDEDKDEADDDDDDDEADDDEADDDDDDDDDSKSKKSSNAKKASKATGLIGGPAFSLFSIEKAHAAESKNQEGSADKGNAGASNQDAKKQGDQAPGDGAAADAGTQPGATTGPEPQHYIDMTDTMGDDGPYLVVKRNVEGPDGQVTLVAMTSLASALRALQTTVQLLVVALLVILALVVFAAWKLTAHTLRPVERMRASVDAIGADDLSARVPVPEDDRDLAPLARTFNEMLGRIEQSVNEQHRFVSDASHELKSPVAATSIILETLREHPEAVDLDQALSDLTSENERMGTIVNDLLALARQDEGRVKVELTPLDLYDILHEQIAALKVRSSVAVDTSGLQPVVCTSDAELVAHVVRNLLDNAARYAKSTVKVSCTSDGETVRITVSDDGPGIAPQDRERVFGRFVRLEDSRSRKEGSTGLGLAVVRGTVEQLGGRVWFDEPELGGATACVELPEQP